MAAQVIIPQKQDDLSKLLGIAGATVGAATGGFAGAGAGLALGQGAGGLLSSNNQVSPVQTDGDAITRRMQQIQPPQKVIESGLASLQYLPKPVQEEYGPILMQARQKYQGVA